MASKPWRSEKIRRPRSQVQQFIDVLVAEMPDGIEYHFGGSWRRGAEEIGDIDVVLVIDDPKQQNVRLPKSVRYDQVGEDKCMGDLEVDGEIMHVDFWICKRDELGAFLWFITGPKELNIAMRAKAKTKGLMLSQYGVYDKEGKQIDDGTEQGVAKALGWKWLEPWQRQEYATKKLANEVGYIEEVQGKNGTYTVRVNENGRITCTCKGYLYRQQCRHVQATAEKLSSR